MDKLTVSIDENEQHTILDLVGNEIEGQLKAIEDAKKDENPSVGRIVPSLIKRLNELRALEQKFLDK